MIDEVQRRRLTSLVHAESALYWGQADQLTAKIASSSWLAEHDQELREQIAQRIERTIPREIPGALSRVQQLLFGSARGALLSAASIARGRS